MTSYCLGLYARNKSRELGPVLDAQVHRGHWQIEQSGVFKNMKATLYEKMVKRARILASGSDNLGAIQQHQRTATGKN